jgi:SAM-dependent methyltransferase
VVDQDLLDADPDAAALARHTLSVRGLADRGSVEAVDIRQALAAGRPAALTDGIDLALLADVIYYVPVDEQVELLRAVARLLAPGGAFVVVTTVAGPQLFSRRSDLLLRAQEAAGTCPPSACCSVSSAGRACNRTGRSGSAGPALHSVRGQ